MSQNQYKDFMRNLLKEKWTLAKLRAELEGKKGSYVDAAKSSGTWPETAGTREKERKR